MELDYSLYPDREIPTDLTDAERAEYVDTPIASRFVVALRDWKDIFDRFPILDSPAYHAIRAYFRWERFTPRYKNTGWKPKWELQDLREGRPPDRAM